MSFNCWGLNLLLNLLTMKETLHKVFLCVFLDIAHILVKIKPHQSELEMKTVCHTRGILGSVVKPNPKWQHSAFPHEHGSVSWDHHTVWWGVCHLCLKRLVTWRLGKLQSSMWNALAEINMEACSHLPTLWLYQGALSLPLLWTLELLDLFSFSLKLEAAWKCSTFFKEKALHFLCFS